MLASELLDAVAVDADGRRVGRVCDVFFRRDGERFRATALLLCDGRLTRLAHAWGFGAGHADGPWPLRALLEPAARRARVVEAGEVAEWSPERVLLRRGASVRPYRRPER